MTIDEFEPPHALTTAVLFLVFNRLDTTKQVFEAIRQAKPPRLYVAADGARASKEGEAQKVQDVREFVLQNIDWDCEVKTLFRDENLGCKYAVSGAITWFFENEEQGIILEDDCLPSQSFFWFCEELLEKYKSDTRIGQISGFNYGFGVPVNDTDYFFSKYGFIWGWATWRRAWNLYDIKMKKFPEITALDTCDLFFGSNKCSQIENFRKVYSNEMDTWDYQWSYSRFINLAYTIVPKDNLIENIGFGDDATHTFGDNPYNDVSRKEVNIADLKHPEYFLQFKDFYAIHEKKSSILRSFFRKVKYAFR